MADEKPPKPYEPTRREFFSLAAGWSAFTLACATGAAAAQRFMYPNVLFEPPQAFKAGFPDEYALGTVEERYKDKYGVWIVRDESGIFALISVCTHLGCTPNWLAIEKKFKCPCHGSGFYPSGINFEGPAPRPLERAAIRLADDGQILVDKSKKFRYELGEWNDPEAVLKA